MCFEPPSGGHYGQLNAAQQQIHHAACLSGKSSDATVMILLATKMSQFCNRHLEYKWKMNLASYVKNQKDCRDCSVQKRKIPNVCDITFSWKEQTREHHYAVVLSVN